ncbi:MAG: dockerin type I domain-containing protein, partial [Ruminiclostridium sp.]
NLYNIVTSPPQYETGLSYKYFVDLSEYASTEINPSKFTTKVYYSPAGAIISSIQPWDKDKNIYYVEVTFPNSQLYARTYVQFAIYNYESKLWDSSNDFSTAGLTDTYTKVENIPIYKNNVKVYGKEQSEGAEILYGDLNNDGQVNAIDFALLKKYLLGMGEDGISLKNADINEDGAVNSIDYANLRLYLLGKIDKLPVGS